MDAVKGLYEPWNQILFHAGIADEQPFIGTHPERSECRRCDKGVGFCRNIEFKVVTDGLPKSRITDIAAQVYLRQKRDFPQSDGIPGILRGLAKSVSQIMQWAAASAGGDGSGVIHFGERPLCQRTGVRPRLLKWGLSRVGRACCCQYDGGPP